MAIRAQDTKIFQPVVTAIAVDVIKLERKRLALPIVDAAAFADRILEARADQSLPQTSGIRKRRVLDEDLVQRARMGGHATCPTRPRLPGHVRRLESESGNVVHEETVDTAAWSIPQSPGDTRHALLGSDCRRKLLIRPPAPGGTTGSARRRFNGLASRDAARPAAPHHVRCIQT